MAEVHTRPAGTAAAVGHGDAIVAQHGRTRRRTGHTTSAPVPLRRENEAMSALPPPVSGYPMADPTAVMGRRIGAYLIDAVLGWAVMIAVFWSVSESVPATALTTCDSPGAPSLCFEAGDTIRFAEAGDANLVTLSGLVAWAVFGILIQGVTGGTPGKLMVGLRVIRSDDGRRAGLGRCTARTLLWSVDAVPYVFPLVGLITGVVSKGHRRVGDMAAGTLVVRTHSVGTPPVVPGLTVADDGAWPPPDPGGSPSAWVPPAAPPTSPPIADLGDPFARPADHRFPTPDPQAPAIGGPPPAGPPVAAEPPPPQPRDDQPTWDPQRNAYVWFDAARSQWLVHDIAEDRWRPL